MDQFLPGFFIGVASFAMLATLAALWMSLRGLFGGDHTDVLQQSAAARRRGELLAEKDAVLRSLKDVEMERELGKISDEDFARLDRDLRRRAKKVLRQLDDDLKEHRETAQRLVETHLKEHGVQPPEPATEEA